MPTAPRILGLLSVLALIGYVFGLAPGIAEKQAGSADVPIPTVGRASGERLPFPGAAKVFAGVTTPEAGYDFADVDMFAEATGRTPGAIMFSQSWGGDTFDRRPFDRIAARGAMPILAWEPGLPDDAGVLSRKVANQPKYQLSRIVAGDFDAYVNEWAIGTRELGYPVAIRFAHEMNGDWYPWAEGANGNKAGEYVAAWRRVHDLFAHAGATNVVWLWSPNVEYPDSIPLAGLYPGDDYVDWAGLVGYYTSSASIPYKSFDTVFASSRAALRQVTTKPLVIAETGATDTQGRRAEWIRDFFQSLSRSPDIIGFIWFQADKEIDWRVLPDTAAASAFATGVADPRYEQRWTPDVIPRRTVEPAPSVTRPDPTPTPSPSVPR